MSNKLLYGLIINSESIGVIWTLISGMEVELEFLQFSVIWLLINYAAYECYKSLIGVKMIAYHVLETK